jgi:hypothetical protein
MPYWTCPDCEANLDHSERCDCKDAKEFKPEQNGEMVLTR